MRSSRGSRRSRRSTLWGGRTSAASPQLAALTALAEQERTACKGPLGNIDPLVYEHSSWFRDAGPVVQGTAASGRLVNNQLWQSNADGSVSPRPGMAHPGADTI
jgi:hypothetical protein